MAITVSAKSGHNLGPGVRMQVYSITMDSSYVGTAGEPCDLSFVASTGKGFANEVYGARVSGSTKGFVCKYKRAASGAPTTGTITVYWYGARAKTTKGQMGAVTTTTNLASINFYLTAWGR